MDSRQQLMKKIQMYSFMLTDLHLYLDSHPFCQNGLHYFKKYEDMLAMATKEYEENYGPITLSSAANGDYWSWVDEPWPWEMEV